MRRWPAGTAVGLAVVTAVGIATVLPVGAGGMARGGDLAEVKRATAPYHRLATAEADGFGELFDLEGLSCIEDAGGRGAMGVHYVNGGRVVDGVIDAAEPEVVLYDLSAAKPRLLGVEYVVFVDDWEGSEPPALFGHQFHLVHEGNRYGLPAFYALHAWVWTQNPSGMFADWNPEVSC
jgi:hypothetical protein